MSEEAKSLNADPLHAHVDAFLIESLRRYEEGKVSDSDAVQLFMFLVMADLNRNLYRIMRGVESIARSQRGSKG